MVRQGQTVARINRLSHRKIMRNRTIYVPFSLPSTEKGYNFVIGVQMLNDSNINHKKSNNTTSRILPVILYFTLAGVLYSKEMQPSIVGKELMCNIYAAHNK